ncbi:dienelactone hydrolase family protein [Fodinibacter luteus]|uniref:Dienelactone hydrolase family protein n=2 Tax=Fodinibacter luteus TaxID=552064 RepID=A0ABP8KQF2_9MICO
MTTVGDLPAYRAVPSGVGPWPGVVLVHEAFGLDDVMRRSADRVAAMGFVVLAPDLLARGRRPVCLARTFAAIGRGRGRAFEDLEATRTALLDDAPCSGAVGVIGFCMGGSFALLLAGRPGWDAASVNYGILPRDLDVLEGACPVVASYGGRDLLLRGAARRLEGALEARRVPHDVEEYPGAGHSFLNDADNAPWYAAPVSRLLLRAGPQPASAEHAWGRIEAFLHDHLGP